MACSPERVVERLSVPGPDVVEVVVAVRLPGVSPADGGILDQVCEVDRQQQVTGGGASVEMVGDPPAQRSLALRVVTAEIRVESFADQMVERDAVAELLAEAAAPKPLQLLLGAAVREDVGQQRHGHAACDRGSREGAPVGTADLGARKPPDHPLDELLVVDAALRPPVGIRPNHLRGQGERERRSLCPGEQLGDRALVEHAVGAEDLAAVHIRDAPDLELDRDPLPASLEPGVLRLLTARDHDEAALG